MYVIHTHFFFLIFFFKNRQVKQSKFPENTRGPHLIGFLLASRSAQCRTASLLNPHLLQRNCLHQQLVEPNQLADTLITSQSPAQSHHTLCLNANF